MQHVLIKSQKNLDSLERLGPGWYVEPSYNDVIKAETPPLFYQANFNPKEYGEPQSVIRTLRTAVERKINFSYLTCFWLIDINLGRATVIIKSENQEVNNFLTHLDKDKK